MTASHDTDFVIINIYNYLQYELCKLDVLSAKALHVVKHSAIKY